MSIKYVYYRCHYPGTLSNNASVLTKKPLWASEDYSTYNDEVGAGCWARVRVLTFNLRHKKMLSLSYALRKGSIFLSMETRQKTDRLKIHSSQKMIIIIFAISLDPEPELC